MVRQLVHVVNARFTCESAQTAQEIEEFFKTQLPPDETTQVYVTRRSVVRNVSNSHHTSSGTAPLQL